MKSFRFGVVLTGAVCAVALAACNKAPADGAAQGPVAATVNGKPISQRTVDIILKQSAPGGHESPEVRKEVIDQIALQMLVAEEAVKKGLDKQPDMAEKLDAVKRSLLANAYVDDFLKNNPISDDALKAEYERIKAGIVGTEYKARHILVQSEAEAKAIIAQLKKDPAAFAKLASTRSKDSGSAQRGGDLGWFDPRRMVPEFSAALEKLEKGKITETPVKTQFGYHVIQLEDSRPIPSPSLEEVKPQLTQQMQQQAVMKQLDVLKSAAKIEVVGAPPAAPAAPAATPAAPAKK
jgi:peptidyl-prolyl cis-trans isomerase C